MLHPLPVLTLLTLLTVAGCGGGGASADSPLYRRLELTPNPPIPGRTTRVVAHLEPSPEGMGSWKAVAPQAGIEMIREPSEGTPDLADLEERPACYLRGAGPRSLTVPCDLEAGSFNAVRVFIRNSGVVPARALIRLRAQGQNVQATPAEFVWSGVGRVPLVGEFPQLRRWVVKIDEVRIEIQGDSEGVTITAVELLRSPLFDFLPATEGLGELVAIDEELRRAVGLSSRHPLTARAHVSEDTRLEFSCGLLELLRLPRRATELRVTVAADGLDPLGEVIPLEATLNERPRWHDASLDLTRFAGREVVVTFEILAPEDREAFAVVAEAALSRRFPAASTVLLITSDTHRGDHLGQYSEDSPVLTPNLDALGDRGVFFSRAHSTTNTTNPSHVAMMTATSPRDTRILDNHTRLVDRAHTVAERFAELGYRTMAVVSTRHLLHDVSGLGQGFERVAGPSSGQRPANVAVDLMEEWLERSDGQPLFLWLHVFDAHTPYEPPPPYDRRYWDGPDPFAEAGGSPPPRRVVLKAFEGLTEKEFPHAQYRAEIDFVDEQVGRLLDRSRIRSGIVAFTADHGESFGEHGIWYSHTGLYPQTTGVPLILSWPGGPRGRRCEELVSHLDLGRTLLDLAGHEAVEFPGRDLRRVLEDSPTIEPHFEISADHCAAAIQTERHRLVLHLRNYHQKSMITRRRLHEVELYDTLADPPCEVNLVREEEHYETAKGLRALLIRWLQNASTDGLRESAVQSVELMKGLEALGYTQGSGAGGSQVFYEEDPEDEWCEFFSR